MTLQEQEAIRRCQAGEEAGLGVLFELHQQSVFRTAYGIMRSHALAEDIAQQVFIEVFGSIKRYDAKRPFRPWLHRIVVNRSLDELRRRKNRFIPIEAAGNLPSPTASPEQAAEESELRDAIRKALVYLEPKHRAVIVLRYYQGFSEAEMSKVLNCRRGTVKSRLHYAIRRLREIFASQASSRKTQNESVLEPRPDRESSDRIRCSLSPEEKHR